MGVTGSGYKPSTVFLFVLSMVAILLKAQARVIAVR